MDEVNLQMLEAVVGAEEGPERYPALRAALAEAGPVEEDHLRESDTKILRSRRLGMSLMVERGVVRSVQLHLHGKRGVAVYQGDLPLGADGRWSLRDLTRQLGPPVAGQGGAYEQWVAYHHGGVRVVFSYGRQGMRRVTLEARRE